MFGLLGALGYVGMNAAAYVATAVAAGIGIIATTLNNAGRIDAKQTVVVANEE